MSLTYINTFLFSALTVSAASSAALFSTLDFTGLALVLVFFASIASIYTGKLLTGSYSNIVVMFLVFGALYGLSGPVAAYYGKGLPPIFPAPYLVNNFLLHYSLALIGLILGLTIYFRRVNYNSAIKLNRFPKWDNKALLLLAYILAFLSSLMEVVNFLRAGGFNVLFAGKADYQSAVSDLTGTLPSEKLTFLSAATLGLALNISGIAKRKTVIRILYWIISSSPVLIVFLVLGRRLEILSIMIIFVIALTYFGPINKIRSKIIISVLLLYIFFGFLYGARSQIGYGLSTGKWDYLSSRVSESEFWVEALSPGANEFGAAFGNFNTYILVSDKEGLRLGETYLNGLTMPIPRFIWPDKPQSITYEFRDLFFSSEAERGSIAGTAFSSILEAYINFGSLGVFLVYFVLGLVLAVLEISRFRSRSISFALFYLMISPVSISFHRSAFENPIFFPMLLSVIGILLYAAFRNFRRGFSVGRSRVV